MRLELSSDPVSGFDEEIRARARDLARTFIAPRAEDWERTGTYPREVVEQISGHFGGFLVPETMGGIGGRATDFLIMVEEFARADIAFALAFVVHHHAGLVVSLSDDDDLRARHLPDLISGKKIGAFCLTEPHAGSDAAQIETAVEGRGDQMSLTGTKAWVTSGAVADFFAVFACTDHARGARGMGCFAVEATSNGVTRGPRYDMIAGHVAQVSDVSFEKVPLTRNDVIIAPGEGFAAAMGALDVARLGIAAMCNGALAAGLETALAYAGQRKMFGETTLAKQGIQWRFADHLTALEASRSLMFQTAKLFEASKSATLAAAHSKKFANETANAGLGWAMRAMGAQGVMRTHGLVRQFQAAQQLFNTDGTPEIMNVVIGHHLQQRFSDTEV